MADYEEVMEQAHENHERTARLRKQGAELDPVSMLAARIELLVNATLGPVTEENYTRLAFEGNWNKQMVEALNNVEAQLRRARLQRLRP